MLQSTPPPHLHLHLWTEAETGNWVADCPRERPWAPYRTPSPRGARAHCRDMSLSPIQLLNHGDSMGYDFFPDA